jgi:hypothetical protein
MPIKDQQLNSLLVSQFIEMISILDVGEILRVFNLFNSILVFIALYDALKKRIFFQTRL